MNLQQKIYALKIEYFEYTKNLTKSQLKKIFLLKEVKRREDETKIHRRSDVETNVKNNTLCNLLYCIIRSNTSSMTSNSRK